MKEVEKEWFAHPATYIARHLLGKMIKYRECAGIIVETEAYMGDPASHAFKRTPRSEIMHTTYGKVYVYFIYGNYYCLNFTTNQEGPGAVLIRAVEPTEGIELMEGRRRTSELRNLTSGPGKLCTAFDITKELNGTDLHQYIHVYDYRTFSDKEIVIGKRIGITKATDLDWRYYVKGNPFVSKL